LWSWPWPWQRVGDHEQRLQERRAPLVRSNFRHPTPRKDRAQLSASGTPTANKVATLQPQTTLARGGRCRPRNVVGCFPTFSSSARVSNGAHLMRYKAKSVAALQLALGGLPDQMRVEIDTDIGVSAKTVGELRKVTAWPDNLAITTPLERDPESTVKVNKASVATRTSPKP
jgi:hypothetical protein